MSLSSAPAETSHIRRTPLSYLTLPITPVGIHFVRDHRTTPPLLDPTHWRLVVDGLVDRCMSLELTDLEALPMVDVTATLECAGNGGVNGRLGGIACISTAVWRGPRLRDVLALCGVTGRAREVIATGADVGPDPDDPPGSGVYERSLPLAKALEPDTLVALFMNDAPLPVAHGFPVRLLVPGWYGMDSIKWLRSVRLTATPSRGFYVRHRYRARRGADGLDTGRPVRAMLVKALIGQPADGDRLPVGAPVRVAGAAWCGASEVAAVVLSVDGGCSWQPADLEPARGPYAWRQWSSVWQPTVAGRYVLVARATDARGQAQPLAPVPGQVYEANWVQPITVEVG